MVDIDLITSQDAECFLDLLLALDAESSFMMLEIGERSTDLMQIQEQIRQTKIIAARQDRLLLGYLSLQCETFRRNRHTAYIVCGIRQAYQGQGIGTRLFAAAETWAKANGIHRLELTVMCHNERAIALYQKMGFEREGIKRHSLKVNNKYVDEFYMAKLIDV
ncbi:MAG: GNAT family N-acetyltransferase [Anaerolineae bacterium]|nr:GNAT family N-acetyltransferase [Anaerolineae bacterium]